MSPGIRSGVNCRRWKLPPVTSARVRTASVLATPGTPSSSRCPRASRAMSIRSTIASCPTSTRLTSKSARSRRAALRSVAAASISAVGSWASGISGGWLSEVVMGRSSDSLVADLNSAPERQNGGRVRRSWDGLIGRRTDVDRRGIPAPASTTRGSDLRLAPDGDREAEAPRAMATGVVKAPNWAATADEDDRRCSTTPTYPTQRPRALVRRTTTEIARMLSAEDAHAGQTQQRVVEGGGEAEHVGAGQWFAHDVDQVADRGPGGAGDQPEGGDGCPHRLLAKAMPLRCLRCRRAGCGGSSSTTAKNTAAQISGETGDQPGRAVARTAATSGAARRCSGRGVRRRWPPS